MRIKPDRGYFIGCLALLPAWLGGAPGPVGLGLLGLALAIYFFFFPPESLWHGKWKWFWVVAISWPLAGWLPRVMPASWHGMLSEAGLVQGWTWHPQPLLLWSAWLMVLLGMAWILALFGRPLGTREGIRALRCFAVGVVLLAAIGIGTWLDHVQVPWWQEGQGLGPFPNRNQSGNVYALSALMLLGLAAHESRSQKKHFWIWIGGGGFLFLATILNGSRAGVALFLIGVGVWALWQLGFTKQRAKAGILGGGALLFLAAFLFFGGEALSRLQAMLPGQDGLPSNPLAGRWEIWQDTLAMSFSSPLRGVGLGNFSDLAGLFRAELVTERRVIHPESDFFWWFSELGVPGIFLIAGGVYWGVRPFFVSKRQRGRRLRSVAMVACFCFLLHSLVDVSAHRLGSLFPALLFLRLTWPPEDKNAPAVEGGRGDGRIAVVCGCIGLWFLLPALGWLPLPSSGYVERARHTWHESFQNSPGQAVKKIEGALKIHPLDWELRYALGASLWAERNTERSWAAFKQARLLEPGNAELPYAEGKLWVERDPARAWVAWREALERRTINSHGLLKQMLRESRDTPELQEALLFLAARMPELQHLVLDRLSASEFELQRQRYLTELSPDVEEDRDVMKSVFASWSRRQGPEEVYRFLQANPHWNVSGWQVAAEFLIAEKRPEEAVEFLKQALPAPSYPRISNDLKRRQWHLNRLLRGSRDRVSLYSFLLHDSGEVSLDQGKEWIQLAMRGKKPPAFFYYLVGEYLSESGDWNGAARAFLQYGSRL